MSKFFQSIRRICVAAFSCALFCAALAQNNNRQPILAEQSNSSNDSSPTASRVENFSGAAQVYFEANRGQQDSRVRYMTRGTNATLFLTATEAVYVLDDETMKQRNDETKSVESQTSHRPIISSSHRPALAVYMTLAGANRNAEFAGQEQLAHRTNYFKGNDSSKWQTDVPNFGRVSADNIYNGVDIVWHGKQNGEVQYDFIIEPNANPKEIEWQIDGARNVSIDADGSLLIETELGTLRQGKPFSYQETTDNLKQEIESGYVVSENRKSKTENRKSFSLRFEVGNYNRSKPLTIDPSVNLSNLAFSTLLGGEGDDRGESIAVDAAGNVYVTGQSFSALFPTTPGSFDQSFNGSQDVFVTKINAAGTALIYSTYLGTSPTDLGTDIKVDSSGNAFITGQTGGNFPTTAGAFNTINNGSFDAFVTKLNSTGSTLIYSTLIGGNNSDESNSIAIDSLGNAYLTGSTIDGLTDYPTTAGAFDTAHNGGSDVFVTKLNAGGTALIYSTFVGGSATDSGNGIAVDSAGNAYLTGFTFDGTTDYPTTAGAFDPTFNGLDDVFVTKLNASGTALIYSTLIGGSSSDEGNGIVVDSAGNAYLTGLTNDGATDYPTTTGTFDTAQNGSNDAFVTKLNANGTALIYSTFVGGGAADSGNGIAVDSAGNAYLTGSTIDATTDYPTTADAFDPSHNGVSDAFVTKLNASGTALVYSSFIGVITNDSGNGIAVDSAGNAYLTGTTFDGVIDYPTTPEAFQSNNNGSNDVFVSKFGDFAISGRAIDNTGAPIGNVAVALSDTLDGFMLTDAQGFFGFTDTATGGSFTVAATHLFYNFTPPTFQIPSLNGNRRFNFLGRPASVGPTSAPARLGGKVRSTAGNVPLPNSTLLLTDVVNPANSRTVVTDQNGNYSFDGVLTGRYYFIFAWRDGYDFDPSEYGIVHLGDNLNLDFLAAPNSPRPTHDFDGDGKSDLAVFRPANGTWYVLESQANNFRAFAFGTDGDVPLAKDYDGDAKTDFAVYRPSNGVWYIQQSRDGFKAASFGNSTDKPVPADFDGDGKTDIAVFRESNGTWHRINSSNGTYAAAQFGASGDRAVTSDFDGDGKSELTVYRPSTGAWYLLNHSTGQFSAVQFGAAEDRPVAADYDGDGRTDIAVFRPSNGTWYYLESTDGEFQARQFGIASDIPVPADYNGDGRYEQAVFRSGNWFVLRSNLSSYGIAFGQTDDVPTP